jgi:hypothetical protein
MIGKTILHYKILEKLGEACPYGRSLPQARGDMFSLSRKYDKLIPQAGDMVYKAEDTKDRIRLTS